MGRQVAQDIQSFINIALVAHGIDEDIVRDDVRLAALGAHLVEEHHGLPVAARLAGGVQEDAVGDDARGAPPVEHVVEHREGVRDAPADAERADERVEGERVRRERHAADEAARVLDPAGAAVPVDHGVVGDDGGGGAERREHALRVGDAAARAQPLDEDVAGDDGQGQALPAAAAGGNGIDERERVVDLLALDEAAQAPLGSLAAPRRGPRLPPPLAVDVLVVLFGGGSLSPGPWIRGVERRRGRSSECGLREPRRRRGRHRHEIEP